MDRFRSGTLVGKFMPPTDGHGTMIRFAAGMCDELTVVVDNVDWQDVSPGVRASWIRTHFAGYGNVRVVALPRAMPQDPGDDPDFWRIWRDAMLGACESQPEVLIASEVYGDRLSKELGCRFMPYDTGRDAVPISATQVRDDPWGNWWQILPEARSHYLRRVALEGPESTGKSTLALHLARRGGFAYAPEWAKGYIEHLVRTGRDFVEADLVDIARGQAASERAVERSANRVVVHDSTLLTTMVWGLFRYGRCDPRIERMFEAEEARAPRTRWILTPETPFVADAHRNVAENPDRPETRERFLDLMLRECERRGLPHRLLRGGHEAKRSLAETWMDEIGPPAMPSPDPAGGPAPGR